MKNKFSPDGIRIHDSCIRGKRLTARPRGPHGRERTTPRLILKHLESIFPQRQPPDTIWHREDTPETFCKLTQLANADQIFSILCRQGFEINFVLFNFNTFSFILVLQYFKLEGKIRFSQFTLFYRVECEKLFCKSNIKLKVLKLNKTKFISKLDDIKLKTNEFND